MDYKSVKSDWYKSAYDLNMKLSSWTFSTMENINFVVKETGVKPPAAILDLACGYGRHSVELAKRGFAVVGTDISPELIAFACEDAVKNGVFAKFLCTDIRNFNTEEKFDLVLNLYDGAIGYLENDTENLKIFDIMAESLKPGGLSLVHLHRVEYARQLFPQRLIRESGNVIEEILFHWDEESKMMYETTNFVQGIVSDTVVERKRLYPIEELHEIMLNRGMEIIRVLPDLNRGEPDEMERYFSVLSRKK